MPGWTTNNFSLTRTGLHSDEEEHGACAQPRRALAAVAIIMVGLTAIMSVLSVSSAAAAVATPARGSAADGATSSCRYGLPTTPDQVKLIPEFGAGWFMNYGIPLWPGPWPANQARYVHLIKTFQDKTAEGEYLPSFTTGIPLDQRLADYLRKHPGELWVVGNEVDRGPNVGQITGGQGDMYPHVYAQAYHTVYSFIKAHDPTARLANAGLVQVTPGRLQYLDMVWNAYLQEYGVPMPVDVWNMHVYVLPELEADGVTPNGIANVALGTDPALGKRGSGGNAGLCSDESVYCFAEHDDLDVFSEQVVAMRKWMVAHGQQQKPLILSEFSILYPFIDDGDTCFVQDEYGNCFTPERVSTFMLRAFEYFRYQRDEQLGYGLDGNRLVQQSLWFSIHTNSVGSSSNLVYADLQTLTLPGEVFKAYAHDEPADVNLVVDRVPQVIAAVGEDGTASADIRVVFRNGGNVAVTQPFTVTFYADAALQKEIGTSPVTAVIDGCGIYEYEAWVNWAGLAPGVHQFWVVVDSGDVIAEAAPGQDDNRGIGRVQVYAEQLLLPAILR